MNTAINKHKTPKKQKLYPMSSFGIVSGFAQEVRITKLEDRLNPVVAFPHKHNFYHIVVVINGSGVHEIDFNKYKATAGSVFFMLPTQVHSWNFSKDTRGIVIEFEKLNSFFSEEENFIFTKALRPKTNHLNTSLDNQLVHLAKDMLKEYSNKNDYFEMVIKLKLGEFLIQYLRQTDNIKTLDENKAKISIFAEQFLKLVDENYRNKHKVDFYANHFDLTSKSLTAKVNRHIGKSVKDAIQERCLLEAKRLLAYSDLTINEISLTLGFEDSNYFTRLFKQKNNIGPSEFRKLIRKEKASK